MVKGHLEQIPNEVLTVENLSILSVSEISPRHLMDWDELTAKLYRNKIPAAPGLVEYAKFRAGIGHTRSLLAKRSNGYKHCQAWAKARPGFESPWERHLQRPVLGFWDLVLKWTQR